MVASGTRKARAISVVVKPPSVRRVRATWASLASAGWQQVNISLRRSSAIALISTSSGSGAASSSAWAARCFWSRWASRRSRSMALRRAVVSSHAPGRFGIPDAGHAPRAATMAS